MSTKDPEPLSKYWAAVREDYKITRRLGKGAYGEVVKAKYRKTSEIVAIKMMAAQIDGELEKVVAREVEILKHLSKANRNNHTVKLHRVIKATIPEDNLKVVFLVMDYVPQTLAQFLRSKGGLQESEVRELLYNLLTALNFLHGQGVMHRDIKPANILVGDDLSVRLCDFGLAKFTEHRSAPKRKHSHHVVTRYYRPPEVILMEDLQGPFTDIWSAGCIAVEVIAKQDCYYDPKFPGPKVLFQGSSCFPMSPPPLSKKKVEVSDQLRVILALFGKLGDKDTSFIEKNSSYFERVYTQQEKLGEAPIDFAQEFPRSPAPLVALVSDMLQFNPLNRKPANQLLDSSYFKL